MFCISCWHASVYKSILNLMASFPNSFFFFFSEGRTRKNFFLMTLTLLHFSAWNIQTRSQIKAKSFLNFLFVLVGTIACSLFCFFSYHSHVDFCSCIFYVTTHERIFAWIVNVRIRQNYISWKRRRNRKIFMCFKALPAWLIAGCLDCAFMGTPSVRSVTFNGFAWLEFPFRKLEISVW